MKEKVRQEVGLLSLNDRQQKYIGRHNCQEGNRGSTTKKMFIEWKQKISLIIVSKQALWGNRRNEI